MQPRSVLATVTGRDRPGVMAAFLSTLAAHDVDVRDVGLVVIRDRLILTVLLDLRGDPGALRNSATSSARALGMECELTVAGDEDSKVMHRRASEPRSHVTVLAQPLRPGALSHVVQRIADIGGNIEWMSQTSSEPVSSIEMSVSGRGQEELRPTLVQAAEDTGVDIAIEAAGLRRLAKRLVLLDLDSTLLIGDIRPAHEQAALVAGLPVAEVRSALGELELAPGAGDAVGALRQAGFRVGCVSESLSVLTEKFVTELGLDFAASNELEISDGRMTGQLAGELMDGHGKVAALRRFAGRFGISLRQTIAVGAGAPDATLLTAAGLAIAFNAGAARRAAADPALHLPYLDTVLFVLGIARDESGALPAS